MTSISAEARAAPLLPPLLSGHPLPPAADPFAEAVGAARRGMTAAGDLFWRADEDRLDLALMLEPQVPARRCLDMLFAAMVAFGDAVGALAPPEVSIRYRWPCLLLANGAELGAVALAAAEDLEGGVPRWLVVGLRAAIRPRPGAPEPGLAPQRTTLWDEGCGTLSRDRLLEAWSRHFLAWLDCWESEGSRPLLLAWQARGEAPGEAVRIAYDGGIVEGRFLGLDAAGDMLLRRDGGTSSLLLPRALAAASGVAAA